MDTGVPESENCDIAIVGGGMVGLSLALMLSKLACVNDIRVIEPKGFALTRQAHATPLSPSFDARSTALSSGSIALFRQLGLWSDLVHGACPIDRVAVSDKGHIGFTDYVSTGYDYTNNDFTNNDSKDSSKSRHAELGAVVENRTIGEVLARAASQEKTIQLHAKTHVTAMQPVSAAMQVEAENETGPVSYRARLVVLADGALSPLAKNMGIQFTQHNYRQSAIIANVAHSEAHASCAYECFSEAGPLAMLPLRDYKGQHRSALVWTHAEDEAEAVLALDDSAFIARLQKQFGYRLGNIRAVGNRQSYPLNLYLAKEQVRSNLVLMGNAAHFLHPVAGQGFNLAMRDCAELCDQLRKGHLSGLALGQLGVLQNYAKARWTDQRLTTELSHGFIQLFASGRPLKQAMRNTGLLALNALPPLKSAFFRQMMGTAGKGASLS